MARTVQLDASVTRPRIVSMKSPLATVSQNSLTSIQGPYESAHSRRSTSDASNCPSKASAARRLGRQYAIVAGSPESLRHRQRVGEAATGLDAAPDEGEDGAVRRVRPCQGGRCPLSARQRERVYAALQRAQRLAALDAEARVLVEQLVEDVAARGRGAGLVPPARGGRRVLGGHRDADRRERAIERLPGAVRLGLGALHPHDSPEDAGLELRALGQLQGLLEGAQALVERAHAKVRLADLAMVPGVRRQPGHARTRAGHVEEAQRRLVVESLECDLRGPSRDAIGVSGAWSKPPAAKCAAHA